MTVTDIKLAVKNKDRAHVYMDDAYKDTLYVDFIVKEDIRIGREFSPDEWNRIVQESYTKKLFNLSLNYIARRLRSEKEIRDYISQKLFKLKIDIHTIPVDEIINKLKHYNYLNDEKFAEEWVKARLKKGLGPERIRLELRQKGIEKYTIEQILSDIDSESKDIEIEKLSIKYLKNKTFSSEREKEWKLKQYLRSRGF